MRKKWLIDKNGRECTHCTQYSLWNNFNSDAGHSTGKSRYCKMCANKRSVKRSSAYKKRRAERDPVWKVKERIRGRIREAIKAQRTNKHNTTKNLIGCNNEDLRSWLESKFYPHPITGEIMTWNNHGFGFNKWHVDHVIPLCKFDLSDVEQQKKANHFSNLQPMWQHENFAKKKSNF